MPPYQKTSILYNLCNVFFILVVQVIYATGCHTHIFFELKISMFNSAVVKSDMKLVFRHLIVSKQRRKGRQTELVKID